MKKNKFALILGMSACFMWISCSKEERSQSPQILDQQISESRSDVDIVAADYLLDGVAVSAGTFEIGNTNYHIDISLEAWPDPSHLKATIRAFTTKNKYIAYGGPLVQKQLFFEERMQIVADSAGFPENPSDEYSVPAWYVQYGAQLYGSLFSPNLLLGCNLHKNATGGNPNWYFPSGPYPFMPPGWNNTVSSWAPLCVGCGFFTSITVYDKIIWRKNLGVINYPFTVGNVVIPFVGPLSGFNDRMSSFKCFSI